MNHLIRLLILALMIAAAACFTDLDRLPVYLDRSLLRAAALPLGLLAVSYVMMGVKVAGLLGLSPRPVGSGVTAALLSQGMQLVLPGRLGELVKPVYFRARLNLPFSRGLAVVLLERMSDIILLGAMALAASFWSANGGAWGLIAGLVLVVTLACAVPALAPMAQRVIALIPFLRIRGFLQGALAHAGEAIRGGSFWASLPPCLAQWVCAWLAVSLFLMLAGTVKISFAAGLAVFMAATLGGAIPVMPAGIGTYEAGAGVVLIALGFPREEALILAISLHAMMLAIPVAFTVAMFILRGPSTARMVADLRRQLRSRQGSVP